MFKRFLILAAVGATLGFIAAMFFGPGLISWWFVSPGTQTVLSCEGPINAALRYFVNLQLIIAGTLAVVFGGLGLMLRRKKVETPATTPPAPPAPLA